MALSPKESMEGIGYELVRDKEGSTLYHDGEAVSSRIETDEGYSIIENGSKREFILDGEGRIREEISGHEIRRNSYSDDGLLLSSALMRDGELAEFSTYYYDSERRISRIDTLEKSYMLGPDALYFGRGDDISLIAKGLGRAESAASQIERDRDGNIRVMENDGIIRTYDSLGRITEERDGESSTSYIYDGNGELERQEERVGESLTVSFYGPSGLERKEYYTSGVLSRRVDYAESIVETRYRNGKEYALITYDSDGRTIRDVLVLSTT